MYSPHRNSFGIIRESPVRVCAPNGALAAARVFASKKFQKGYSCVLLRTQAAVPSRF